MAWRRAARFGRVPHMSPETVLPETIWLVLAFAIGFAVAGMVATGYQAVTRRPASFRLLRRGPAPSTFAAVPVLAFAAPFIILRDALRRRRTRRMPSDALLFLSMAASFWSIMSGTVVVMAIEALQRLVA
jgi:hypothetical protein